MNCYASPDSQKWGGQKSSPPLPPFLKKHLHNLVRWACSFLNNDAFGQSPNQPSFSGATTLAEVKLACLTLHLGNLGCSLPRPADLLDPRMVRETALLLWQGWLLGREGQCTFAIVLQAAGGLFCRVVAVLAVGFGNSDFWRSRSISCADSWCSVAQLNRTLGWDVSKGHRDVKQR